MKRSELVFVGVQIPLDYLALVASFVLSYWVRVRYPSAVPGFIAGPFGDSLNYTPNAQLLPYQHYLNYILVLAGVMTLIFILSGLYRWNRFPRPAETFSSVVRAVANAFLIVLLIAFARGSIVLPRLVIIYALALSVVLLTLSRGIVSAVRQLLHRWQIAVIRMAILGSGEGANRAIEVIRLNRRAGYQVTDTFAPEEINALRRVIRRRLVDEVLVASHLSEQELVELREYCIEHRVGLLVVPSVFTFLSSKLLVRDLAGYAMVEIPVTPLEGWGFIVKRVADLILSLLALITLLPLLMLIALIVWLDDPGPIFFRHNRLGEDLHTFRLWKFRTMKRAFCDGPGFDATTAQAKFQEILHADPTLMKEWQKYQKLKDDPRVTRVGRWLRKLSLDELPQFINVLMGDLSLVGPRPIVKSELPKYGRLKYRLGTIKPGATGLWQVSGRNDTTYEERVRLDMVYIENWSIWLDLTICLRTVWVMLFRRGAY